MRNPQHRDNGRVAAELLDRTGWCLYEQQGDVAVRRAGNHVPRVGDVSGGVGDDKGALGCREVAVGDVDSDSLLALGAKAIGDQGEVEPVPSALDARLLYLLDRVAEQKLGVVEEPADQRALARVDRPGHQQPKEVASVGGGHIDIGKRGALHQKYPERLRSSIAASVARSSARVSPRSVLVEAEISATTSGMVAAVDSTAPVQVMSPTVR